MAGSGGYWTPRRNVRPGAKTLAARGRRIAALVRTGSAVLTTMLAVAVWAAPLAAQSYPSQPIRMVIIFPPGGGIDAVARIVAPKLSELLGRPVLPENRGGAGGNVGLEFVAKARPDGYTLVMGSESLTMSPSLYKKLNYDAIKDLAPVTLVARIPIMLLARPGLPVKDLKELVAHAKANPGKLTYGTGGVGSAPHLAGELFKTLTGANIVHVPYKGVALALTGMIGGEVDLALLSPAAATPQVQAGKAKALAVLGNTRAISLPEVPTVKEAGVDNLNVTGWYGVLAPAGTDSAVIQRLDAELRKIMAMPDTIEKIQRVGIEPLPGTTPEQFAGFIKTEIAQWRKVVAGANIPPLD